MVYFNCTSTYSTMEDNNDWTKELFDSLNNIVLELKNYGFTYEEIIKKIVT